MDSFNFGQVMNENKKLSKVMELIELLGNKGLEHDLECALRNVLEKHNVKVSTLKENTAQSKYPNLTKLYSSYVKVDRFSYSYQLNKINKLINAAKECKSSEYQQEKYESTQKMLDILNIDLDDRCDNTIYEDEISRMVIEAYDKDIALSTQSH